MRVLATVLFLFSVWCLPTAQQDITLTTGGSSDTTDSGPSTTTGLSETVITIVQPGGDVSVQVSTVTVTSVAVSVETVTAMPISYGSSSSTTFRPTATVTRIVAPGATNSTTTSSARKLTPPSLGKVVGSTVIGVGFWLQYGS